MKVATFLFLSVIGTYINLPVAFAQYKLPKDQRYWRYHSWYVSHAVVSLILSANKSEDALVAVSELKKLKQRGILVGEVMIIGGDEKMLAQVSKDLGTYSSENAHAVVSRFKVTNSPTWVVRYRGKDYVYEGLKSPLSLFTTQGEFKGNE